MIRSHVDPRRALGRAGPARRGLGRLALGLAAALTLAPTCAESPSSTATPAFDYAMPDRFQLPPLQAQDAPSPTEDVYVDGEILPAQWRVELDACDSAGPIASYAWAVDGEPVTTSSQCGGTSIEVPAEGTYQVTLTVTDSDGATASTTQPVVVQDFLVFGLGDSYASGEGSPDQAVSPADIDALGSARDAVQAAQAAFSQALAQRLVAQEDLDALLPLLEAARSDYAAWRDAVQARNAACSFPPSGCAAAQVAASTAAAELTVSLATLGLSGLSTAIPGSLQELEDTARNAFQNAQAVVQAAREAREAAQASLAQARERIGPRWRSQQCHRSALSGQVEAARRLEESDPRSSVTFVHLACTGATIARGLVGSYGGQLDQGPQDETLAPQVDRAAALAHGREIDALVVSIGGNDVGFATVIEKCVVSEPCFDVAVPDAAFDSLVADTCAPLFPLDGLCADAFDALRSRAESRPGTASELFFGALAELPGEYVDLDGRLADQGWSTGRAPLHLTAYPRITTREGSAGVEPCGFDPTSPASERRRNLPGVTAPEILWADTIVAPQLQAGMEASADAHGWHFVDAHVSAFDGHGYCADDNWIVRIQQSGRTQARPVSPVATFAGAVHPSPEGHQAYADAILASLRCELYAGCDPASGPPPPRDSDGDGIPDERDLCVDVPDAGQRDTNGDGHGNACDPDLNNDGAVDDEDVDLLKAAFFGSDPDADLNGDGTVDFLDLGLLNRLYDEVPGPSGSL